MDFSAGKKRRQVLNAKAPTLRVCFFCNEDPTKYYIALDTVMKSNFLECEHLLAFDISESGAHTPKGLHELGNDYRLNSLKKLARAFRDWFRQISALKVNNFILKITVTFSFVSGLF